MVSIGAGLGGGKGNLPLGDLGLGVLVPSGVPVWVTQGPTESLETWQQEEMEQQ